MSNTTWIYRLITEDGYVYYEAEDAIMAVAMAQQDYQQVQIDSVCDRDTDIITFVACFAKSMS